MNIIMFQIQVILSLIIFILQNLDPMDCVWRDYCEELNRIAPMQDMAGTVARINRYIIIESILNIFSVIKFICSMANVDFTSTLCF